MSAPDMAQAASTSQINWDRPLQTRHTPPRPATVVPNDVLTPSDRRRVRVRGDYEENHLYRHNPQYDGATTWHYEADGTLAAADPAFALVNS